ncbi:MAG: response regulator [Cyanobacteria bacterium J06649_11]
MNLEKKILIADDEANIRILMEQVLERLKDEGVELLIVENGKEALETIEDEKPDLLFLDMMMPKMNGLDVCKAVKQELKIPNIYIIMLTAKGQEDDKEKGLQMGADLYMTKPFRPKSILEKSREVLGI